MPRLTLNYEPDPADCDGRLFVRVEGESFSGRGYFWAEPEPIERFAMEAAGYPLTKEHTARLRLGYNDLEDEDLIVSIEISPADGVGNILVRVELANLHEPTERVRTSFKTNYPELERFVDALLDLVNDGVEEAVLAGQ